MVPAALRPNRPNHHPTNSTAHAPTQLAAEELLGPVVSEPSSVLAQGELRSWMGATGAQLQVRSIKVFVYEYHIMSVPFQ